MRETVQQVWKKRPIIISGPCSAETEEQVLKQPPVWQKQER